MRLRFTAYDKMMPLSEMQPSHHQRTDHPDDQIENLALIMKDCGIRHPIHISKQSGNICFGHGRKAAALLNGYTEYPIVYQDFDSDQEEYLCVQNDNAIAMRAELDESRIQEDLKNMPDVNTDLLGIKDFKIIEIEVLEPQCDEDAVPEHVEPKTKLGDIYQLGRHRLMCGDSTSIDAVEKLMNGEKADMVFTDPPYGMAYKSNAWDSIKSEVRSQRTNREIEGDENTDVGKDAIRLISALMGDEGHIFVWCRWDSFEVFRQVVSEFAAVKGNIVWDKGDSPGLGDLECSFGGNELAVHAIIGRRKIKHRINSVWRANRPKGLSMVHPTQKPIEIIEPALENCTNVMDTVLDLFGGSGSTLIACEKTNRNCFMMELDPHYIDVIVARWEKYTGKKAELVNGPTTD